MSNPTNLGRRSFLQGATAIGALGLSPALGFAVPAWHPSAVTRVAVIGCGPWGRQIISELHGLEGAEVVAVADPVASRLKAGLRKGPTATGFASLAEIREAKLDVQAVVIATPSHLHTELVLEALGAKFPVYCEAPMATTPGDVKAIEAAAKAAGVPFTCGLLVRSNPLYAHARNFVRSGAIADFVGFRAQHHEKTTWNSPAVNRADEKALNWRLDPELSLGLAGEFGVHQFDVIHWYTGMYPSAVRGDGSIQLHRDGRKMHDTVHLDMEYPGHRMLRYDATIANSFQKRFELFHGTAGSVKMAQNAGWLFKESDAPTIGFEVYAGRQYFHDEEGITLVADATKLAAQERIKNGVSLQEPPLRFALKAFLLTVQEGAEPHCSATEGARASHVAIAAATAVASGERIEIDQALFTED